MRIPFLNRSQKRGRTSQPATWRDWLGSIFFAAIAATVIRWMVLALYVIPSSSMEPTLLAGDYVVVSKFHYGARTPITPLQLPITHQKIPGTNLPSFLNWIQFPSYRLPGWRKVKRNDVIVFNTPIGDEPPDLREYWIKRCVACPGDVVHITHKTLYVNDTLHDIDDKMQYHYFMRTKRILTAAFFEKNGIQPPVFSAVPGQEGYAIYTTPAKVKQLSEGLSTYVQSVEPIEDLYANRMYSYPHYEQFGWTKVDWTKDNFGPITVPKKGMAIAISRENILLYRRAIENFEGQKHIRFTADECWINEQLITEYTFRKNYYFAMGDNRDQSVDSRFIGFIPEDYIVGKAIIVLFSSDRNKHWIKGMRWNRLFQRIN